MPIITYTPELLEKVRNLIIMGLTKEKLESLYREPGWQGSRKIAQILTEEFDQSLTQKHIITLFHELGIDQWTPSEKRIAEKALPENLEKTKEKIDELISFGFTEEKIRNLYYSENKSKNEIIEIINETADRGIINKNWLVRVSRFYNIEEKPAADRYKARELRTQATSLERFGATNAMKNYTIKAKAAKKLMENGGYTLQREELRKEIVKKRIEASNAAPRKYELLLDKFNGVGYSEAIIRKLYGEANLSTKELLSILNESLSEHITLRTLERFLDFYKIKKSLEQIKVKQGNKSRAEKSTNLQRLTTIGHTPESAADYYENNKTVTWFSLVDEFNKLLSNPENPFTEKWLVKTLDPHFTSEFKKLRGSSRAENNFGEYLKSIYGGPVEQGKYKIIPKYQLDFHLPKKALAIEFNGDYWHSDEFLLVNHGMTAQAYHGLKRELCEAAGFTLAFVWESDWYYQREKIETSLKLLLDTGEVSENFKRLS